MKNTLLVLLGLVALLAFKWGFEALTNGYLFSSKEEKFLRDIRTSMEMRESELSAKERKIYYEIPFENSRMEGFGEIKIRNLQIWKNLQHHQIKPNLAIEIEWIGSDGITNRIEGSHILLFVITNYEKFPFQFKKIERINSFDELIGDGWLPQSEENTKS